MAMKFKKIQEVKCIVKKINKSEFLNLIQSKTRLSKDECLIVNDILERNFLIGNKNKQNIINELIDKLSVNEEKTEEIYNISMNIISLSLKEKLKHPFKSQD